MPVELNRVTGRIVEAAIAVHRVLGPGLLESVYEECLALELRKRRLKVGRQVVLPLVYEGTVLQGELRLDLVVEDLVVVELKATEAITGIHRAQLLTYLRLSGLRVGLLMNFNVAILKEGIVRLIV